MAKTAWLMCCQAIGKSWMIVAVSKKHIHYKFLTMYLPRRKIHVLVKVKKKKKRKKICLAFTALYTRSRSMPGYWMAYCSLAVFVAVLVIYNNNANNNHSALYSVIARQMGYGHYK